MTSSVQDFGANNQPTSNPSATGATGSTNSNDPVTASYGNTHSSTGRTNPIHPSDPQSTAHPAYGNSTFSSPYETGGGNTAQGDGEGPGVGQGTGTGQGAGVGKEGALGTGGSGGLGREYHDNVDAVYGHATGRKAPEGYVPIGGEKKAGPYDTAGGNAAQAGGGEGSTHMGGAATQPSVQTGSATTGSAVPDTGYRAQPYTAGNNAADTTAADGVDNRSTGSKVKEIAQGVKGLFAAAHGAGETARGTFNAGVDRRFNEVLDPHPIPFPSLKPLEDYAEDGDGEYDNSMFEGIKASGEEKNRILAEEGKQEFSTGMFSDRTKQREGVVPGDSELRRNREL